MTTNAIGCAPCPLKPDQRRTYLTPIAHRAGVRDVSTARILIAKPVPTFAEYALSPREIQKMPPCPVLGLHDPGIRVEPDFLDEALFH